MWSGASRVPGFWIARRYLVRRSNGYAALTHWVSFVGLTLGVTILTVVVSVMNGFDRELKGRLLGVVPHGFVQESDMDATRLEQLRSIDGMAAVDRFFRGEAMVSRPGAVNAVQLYGVDRQGAAFIADSMTRGDIGELAGGIVLGSPLARMMGLAIGDPVILLLSTPTRSGVVPRIQKFELRGTFEVGADPDYGLAIIDVEDVRRRQLASSGELGWRLTLADPFEIDTALRDLDLPVLTWSDEYGELFRAVKIEKTIMFVLLALVIAIAAFNIVSGQAMLVNDKRTDIAILTTMGADRSMVVRVFVVQGLVVSVSGIAIGLLLGVVIAVNAGAVVEIIESLLGASMIEGTYFSSVPSEIRLDDLVVIGLLALLMCSIAIVRPAMLAARSNPAEALHAQ